MHSSCGITVGNDITTCFPCFNGDGPVSTHGGGGSIAASNSGAGDSFHDAIEESADGIDSEKAAFLDSVERLFCSSNDTVTPPMQRDVEVDNTHNARTQTVLHAADHDATTLSLVDASADGALPQNLLHASVDVGSITEVNYGTCCSGNLCKMSIKTVTFLHCCAKCDLPMHVICGVTDSNDLTTCFSCLDNSGSEVSHCTASHLHTMVNPVGLALAVPDCTTLPIRNPKKCS
jgi:hypothetical protein